MRKNVEKTKNINAVAPEYEIPFTGNAAYLPYEEGQFTSSYDAKADELRQKNLNLPDTPPKTERVYYFSYKGDDNNDGMSPETPWKSLSRLGRVIPNSTVLFERGGVYRGGKNSCKPNVFYGAYGKGPKPQILGSLQNYSVPEIWKDEGNNIWSIEIEGATNIGQIIFDHGVVSAMKEVELSAVNTNYTFQSSGSKAYLYFDKGNPALYHESIEIMDHNFAATIFSLGGNTSNVTFENLCLKYGNFGISSGGYVSNITVRGCEIGFMGGCAMLDDRFLTRWGNGVEIWGNAVDVTIENCNVYQCYDAGLTHQCATDPNNTSIYENIRYTENLIEFCQYNFEFFNSTTKGSYSKNVLYNKNICRFAGYQVFDPKNRGGSDSSYTALFNLPERPLVYYNCVIEDNILDTSYGHLIKSFNINERGGLTVRNNEYLQQAQMPTYFYTYKDRCPIVPMLYRGIIGVKNKKDMENALHFIDKAPKSVDFE